MSRLNATKIKVLVRRRAACRRQVAALAQTHAQLQLRLALLQAWCQVLALVLEKQPAVRHEGRHSQRERVKQLSVQEADLLQELDHTQASWHTALPAPEPTSLSGYLAANGGGADSMAYLRRTLQLGPLAEAQHWTALELAMLLRETVLQCNLYISHGKLPLDGSAEEHLVKELWDRYFTMLTFLVLEGRQSVAAQICSCNLATMEFSQENAAAADEASVAPSLLPRLGLVDSQKDLIAIGADTCDSLAQQYCTQWTQVEPSFAAAAAAATAATTAGAASDAGGDRSSLQSGQPAAVCEPASSASQQPRQAGSSQSTGTELVSVAAAAAAASSSSVLTSMPGGESLAQRRQQLELQQQQLSQVSLLLHKESTLSHVLQGLVVGALTYSQLSHMFVMCWLYSVNLPLLAKHIHAQRLAEMAEVRRQQQREQQRQSRRKEQQPAGATGEDPDSSPHSP